MIGCLIKIKTDFGATVYGRVYLYEEQTKTLILSKFEKLTFTEVIDDEYYKENKTESIVGMGVYNCANIQFEGVELDTRRLSEQELQEEYQTGELPAEDKQSSEYKEADKNFKAQLSRGGYS